MALAPVALVPFRRCRSDVGANRAPADACSSSGALAPGPSACAPALSREAGVPHHGAESEMAAVASQALGARRSPAPLVNPKGLAKKMKAAAAGQVAGGVAARMATGDAHEGAPGVRNFGRVGYVGYVGYVAVRESEIALVRTEPGAGISADGGLELTGRRGWAAAPANSASSVSTSSSTRMRPVPSRTEVELSLPRMAVAPRGLPGLQPADPALRARWRRAAWAGRCSGRPSADSTAARTRQPPGARDCPCTDGTRIQSVARINPASGNFVRYDRN
jgi:hypothetical protein